MPPPFRVTPRVLGELSRIDQSLGRLSGLAVQQPQPLLRKRNQVRSVQATAAIEGNDLTLEQVTAVLEGQRIVGKAREVQEIVNVNAAYEHLLAWVPTSRRSLLAAHGLLMRGLDPRAGRFRTSGVGVFRGARLAHLAPPAHLVADQVAALLRWLKKGSSSALIAGCVVHYELLFIHPFLDGNGRLARLWQQVIHREHSPLLQFVPVESLVRQRQRAYYQALRRSDSTGDCTPFLEFSLRAVADALHEFSQEVRPERDTASARMDRAAALLGTRWFTRADYLAIHVRLSTATASRDLAGANDEGRLELRGARRLTEYRFRR